MTFVPFVKVRRAKHDDDFETWDSGRPAPTLNAMDNNGDTHATVLIPTISNTISARSYKGTNSTADDGALIPTGTAVRRLTPLECERLMGWPDDHTRWKADGSEQADTHRYKQCGNGVASPVAEWIGKQLMKLDGFAQ